MTSSAPEERRPLLAGAPPSYSTLPPSPPRTPLSITTGAEEPTGVLASSPTSLSLASSPTSPSSPPLHTPSTRDPEPVPARNPSLPPYRPRATLPPPYAASDTGPPTTTCPQLVPPMSWMPLARAPADAGGPPGTRRIRQSGSCLPDADAAFGIAVKVAILCCVVYFLGDPQVEGGCC